MNILTKICVVLLVVVSLVASVVFTTLATANPNWKNAYQQEVQARKHLSTQTTAYMAAVKSSDALLTATRAKLEKAKGDAAKKIVALEASLRERSADAAVIQGELKLLSGKITTLESLMAAKEATNASLHAELKKARDKSGDIDKALTAMGDELQAERDIVVRMTNSLRILKEQVADQKRINADLSSRLASRGKGQPTAAAEVVSIQPEQRILGAVTAISRDLASVNVGSAHGVKKGMELIVFRGDKFVGKLKIEQVRVNESAGLVINKVLTPRQGDKVASNLNTGG